MRLWDRMALAWRGYWAETAQVWAEESERCREEWRTFRAERNEVKHWDLVIRRKITGLDSPTRKDVRRVEREYKRSQR